MKRRVDTRWSRREEIKFPRMGRDKVDKKTRYKATKIAGDKAATTTGVEAA